MRGIPVRASHIVQAESEEKPFQAELRVLEREPRRVAGAHQIADRFIVDAGHIDAREIARAEQPGEFHSVAPVGLHLVAGFLRNQRRRDDVAGEALAVRRR